MIPNGPLATAIKNSAKDRTYSYWLNGALVALAKRDILDAIADVEALHTILTNEWKAIVDDLNPARDGVPNASE